MSNFLKRQNRLGSNAEGTKKFSETAQVGIESEGSRLSAHFYCNANSL